MKKDDLIYIRHILSCIESIEEYTAQMSFENFLLTKVSTGWCAEKS